jgi:hypothetical protein
MSDTRLHIRVIPDEDHLQFWALCGVRVIGTNRRYMSAYRHELDHAVHTDGDVCAECVAFYNEHTGWEI